MIWMINNFVKSGFAKNDFMYFMQKNYSFLK